MKKITFLICSSLTLFWFSHLVAQTTTPSLIISEIVDATLPQGLPKYVELTNIGSDPIDLSQYAIGNFSNGGTTLGGGASTLLSGTLAPGDSYVISYENSDSAATGTFFDTYDFDPDNFDLGSFINGDDVVALFLGQATGDGTDATLIDVYGVIGVDGTSQPWEYTDGYAYRNTDVTAPNSTFTLAEWTIGGANSLETGDDTTELALILAATTPGVPGGPIADTTGPTLVSVDPENGATDVAIDVLLTATFDEPVQWVPDGNRILINNITTNTAHGIIPNGSPLVTFEGNSAIIDPALDFLPNNDYEVLFDFNALQDASGNGNLSISDAWSFTTAAPPTPASIIITEIMYDSGSDEDDWEWMEVYNPGGIDLDISGYVIDDINSLAHESANIVSGIVPAGASVVLYNADDISEADFLAAWGNVNLIAVTNWGAMSLNNGGDTIGIWDSFSSYLEDNEIQANVIEQVVYTDDPPFPNNNDSASIFLNDLTADNSDGANWILSTDGANTPLFDAYTSNAAGGNNGTDIGSPGMQIIPIPELLLSEIVVTPTAGEFIEIYNPGSETVDLSNVYLTDATFDGGSTFYYNIVTSTNAGGGGFGDFLARFPDGASIGAGEYQTIALAGSDDFFTEYSSNPTYELFEDGDGPDAIPDMREGLVGAINNQGGLTNGGEVVILFYWDGQSDLVTDLDYVVWGDKDEAVDKTGISIDGPDADSATSTYLNDTPISSQAVVFGSGHEIGQSFQRNDLTEGNETLTGGNGASGHDETSEDLNVTWCANTNTPGVANDCGGSGGPAVDALISEIQGNNGNQLPNISGSGAHDDRSPLEGQSVTIQGIVTGVYPGLDGFFMQEEDADIDDDSSTSEGIFIFVGNDPTVSVGNLVTVTGAVDEFFGMTQIDNDNGDFAVVIDDAGDSSNLVTATPIDLPVPAGDFDDFYEQYEGMLLNFTDNLFVSEYFQLARFGQVTLTEGGRPFQYTHGDDTPTANEFADFQEALRRRQIIVDDGNNIQNEPLPDGVIFHPQPNGFGVGTQGSDFFRGGDTVSNLTGILQWSFPGFGDNTWRLRPVAAAPTSFAATNTRPSTPDNVGGNITVAAFNVLNYFTTLDEGSNTTFTGLEPRGANSTDELTRQTNKLIEALAAIDADIFGLVELENDNDNATVLAIVNALNAKVGAGTYDFIATGATGTDAIKQALIYKLGVVSPSGAVAVLTNPSFTDPNGTALQRNRPAIAQTFEVTDTNNPDFGAIFTVAVNHFKSKGDSGLDDGPCNNPASNADCDQGDGQGFWNDTRTKAAQALADWLASDPTASGDPDFIILGDLNAYKGETPIAALIDAGYTDLIESILGNNAYSFVFESQLGYLDYAMTNAPMTPQVTSVTEWHINVDEVNVFDYNNNVQDGNEQSFEAKPSGNTLFEVNAFRTSDHDPVIVGLDLVVPTVAFDLQITEMWPGNEPGTNLTSDWFEITNEGSGPWVSGEDPDLFYDDDSQDGIVADIINGITDIQPGERVIIVIGNAGDLQQFTDIWSPAYDLTNIEIGFTDGSGLGQGGDGVTLFVGGRATENIVDFEAYPNAESDGGQSYDVTLAAFSTEGNANNAAATFAVNDAEQPAIASPGNQGSLAPVAYLQITEMWPGNDPGNNLSEDWFEITNTGSAAWESGVDPDLFYDDISQAPGDATPISGITDIQPGERVIIIIGSATNADDFNTLWSADYNLAGIEIGFVDGGSGLGQGGDGVTLWTGDPGGTSDFFLSDFETYPNAEANGGQSYDVELTAFSVAANASNAAVTSTLNDQNQPALASPGNQGPLNPTIDLQITEIWPGQAGTDVTADWFEVYNAGSQAWVSGTNPDLFYDDESTSATDSDVIQGITDIQPGESVVIVIGDAADTAEFETVWSPDYNLTGIEIGFTDGAGLGGGGDAVTLWLGDPRGSGLLSDDETYPDTEINDGQSYDVVNATFSVTGSGTATPGTNEAVATTILGGDLGDTPAVGSPGNQGPSIVDPNAPIVRIDVANLTPLLILPEENLGSVSGVIDDPTDPAATIGIPFTISDPNNDITGLNVAVESGAPVDPSVAITPPFDPSISSYVLTITPSSVGFNTIAIIATDASANQGNYRIEYASSAASVTPATSRFHTGAADGSTAIPTGDYMWVGDDEDQTLRLYDCNHSGLPLTEIDFNSDLGSSNEIDIEGSFQSGNTLYWIGSTATIDRSVLFSTTISGSGANATLSFGNQYRNLREELLNGGFGLPTNIEIEALTLAPGSTTTAYLGFRVPDSGGDAIVIPVTNFTALPGAADGSAVFGALINLDLGGRTLRSMECNDNGCILIGGPNGTVTDFALYTWSGNAVDAPELRSADLTALQTGGSFEGIVGQPESTFLGSDGDALTIKLLSDLGATAVYNDGVENKDQRREWKKFRTDIVTLGAVTDPPVIVPNIVINEILFDPAGDLTGDANGDGTRDFAEDEFIEIVNLDGRDVDISGWTLSDDDGGAFGFPEGTILINNCTAVLFGGGTPTGDFGMGLVFVDDGTIGSGLANGGDVVELRDDEGILIASYAYGAEGVSDQSLTRDPDGTGSEPLVAHSTATGSGGALFSPGTQIDGSLFAGCNMVVLPDLQITEIWPGNEPGENLTEDWFEITNTGDIPWTVSEFGNLFFDDESQSPSDAVVINGITSIAPGEVIIAIDDTDTAQFLAVWSSYDLTGIQIATYSGAGLGQGGDGVTLWIGDPLSTGTLVDFENYPDANTNGGQSYDVSLGAFSTVGNVNNAAATETLNDVGQPATGSPGNQGPLVADVLSVTSFNLINADTDEVLQLGLMEGDVIDVNTLPTMNLNIQAVASDDVESVQLVLSGAQDKTMTENVAPYALFGDVRGNYKTNVFPTGMYSLTATPYSENRLEGLQGTPLTITFQFTDNPLCTTFDAFVASKSDPNTCGGNDGVISIAETGGAAPITYELLETATEQTTGTFTRLTAGEYNVLVTDANGCTETVTVILSDPDFPEVTLVLFADVLDTDPAFVLTGGSPEGGMYNGPGVSGGMFDPAAVGLGSFEIVYTFTDPITGCENSAVQTITVGSTTQNTVTGFVLVNADTNEDIGPITDGASFVISTLATTNLNIRADATSDVESVFLEITGDLTNTRTENVDPYALFGDNGGNYFGRSFEVGAYTVSATPYTGNGLNGIMGTTQRVNFSIVLPPAAPQFNAMRLYPNPASESVNMEFELPTNLIAIQIFDSNGRLIQEVKVEARNGDYQMSVFDLPVGNYFVRTVDERGKPFTEQMVIER
ncbi:MAG: ExeM/NucH family extracellular endonuclease [Bacteroidota bacterium]